MSVLGDYLLGRLLWWIIGFGLIGWGGYEMYQKSLAPEGAQEITLRELLAGTQKNTENPFVVLKDFELCEERVIKRNHASGELWDGWIAAVPAGERGTGCDAARPVQ